MFSKLFYIIILMLVILAFLGCNPAKKIARKDDAAIERVTAKRSLLNRIKAPIDSLWPCIVDTAIVYRKGKTDSLYFIDFQPIDTVNRKRIIDSIGNCDLSAAFDAGVNSCSKKRLIINHYDTLIKTEVDRKGLDICNDARAAAENKAASNQSKADLYRSDRQVCIYFIIGLLILLIGSNILWMRFKLIK